MTEMRVVQVCTCQKTDRPIVLLEDAGQSRWLSFYLPSDEASRLARALKGKAGVPVLDLPGQIATAGDFEVIGAEIDGAGRPALARPAATHRFHRGESGSCVAPDRDEASAPVAPSAPNRYGSSAKSTFLVQCWVSTRSR
jgi:hypothetical protein